jgi:hypothetical protein
MLNEYGVETCSKEFNDCYEEVMAINGELCKDRDKALQMLVDLQKNDPKTFKLTMLIYSLFNSDQESPDAVMDPVVIATLLLRSKL